MVLAITDSESHSTDPASINAARIAGVHQREQDTMPPATRNFPHRGDCGVETLELWEVGIWSDPEKWKLHRIPFKSSKGFGRLLIHKLKVRIFIIFLQYFFKTCPISLWFPSFWLISTKELPGKVTCRANRKQQCGCKPNNPNSWDWYNRAPKQQAIKYHDSLDLVHSHRIGVRGMVQVFAVII